MRCMKASKVNDNSQELERQEALRHRNAVNARQSQVKRRIFVEAWLDSLLFPVLPYHLCTLSVLLLSSFDSSKVYLEHLVMNACVVAHLIN